MEHNDSKDDEGSSNSSAHLEALKLPDLKDKSFLDLGCNDGFFCSHAFEQGAKRVVGIDASKERVDHLKRKMPEGQFITFHLDRFQTKEKFDVILVRSAFQQSKDLGALLKKISGLLLPNGILVFEGPIFPENSRPLWVPATQTENVFWYPTKKLWESVLLSDFSFRHIGPSVAQNGAALPSEVYHCQREMRSWTLISGASKEGKSSYASSLESDNIIRIDWLLRTSVANTMFKGDPIIDQFSRRLKKTKDIGKTVRWIDTDEKAAPIAEHILRHMPTECDLVMEGYLLSNEFFMARFKNGAKELGVRLWHSEKVHPLLDPETLANPEMAPQSPLKQTVKKLSKRFNTFR